ncbi:Calcium-binding mitochondrial carrier [Venturia nashicola]|uniref:Calcium-binding mitochondrial carrier n=1 Tax=Venturia nashicola TaxID=86259 RepID=A0A4Z1PHK5_9PEZI|nr:Calcium-binding mitochondrial carrier [Venturia nashicola]
MTDYGGNYGNYSNTTYSAGGGAGGGGFLTGGSQNSPSGGADVKNDSLRPVTIKQLNHSETHDNTNFTIDNSPISQVTFVGQVRNISQQTTNITYRIDDGTGTLEAKLWIDPDADESTRPAVSENTYVRCWGKLKCFNNKRHVGCHFLRPITDMNEISFHLLEATAVHLHFTKGPPAGKGGAQNGGGAAQQNGGAADFGGGANGALPPGTSAVARKVYNVLLNTPQSNEGLHMHDIATRLGMNTADVGKGSDELLEQGLIYTTVDDHTWAILNTGNF